MPVTAIIQQLRRKRERAQVEVDGLDAAIGALGATGHSRFRKNG